MAKHTPGKWKIIYTGEDSKQLIATDTSTIAVIWPQKNPKEAEANARLIATAPELLGASKEALIDLEFLKDYIPRDSNSIKMLKQAIAKAEQEQHLE